MHFEKKRIECTEDEDHEDILIKRFKTIDEVLECLKETKKRSKLIEDHLFYYEAIKNKIPTNVNQIREEDIKFLSECDFAETIKELNVTLDNVENVLDFFHEQYKKKLKIYNTYITRSGNFLPIKTEPMTKKFSDNRLNSKTNCYNELEPNKCITKQKDNETGNKNESGPNNSETNDNSDESNNYDDDDSDGSRSHDDNESEERSSIEDDYESGSDYYDSNKDYEESEESDITGSDSLFTPDLCSSGDCDCSDCDISSDHSDNFFCECERCRERRFDEDDEFMSESFEDDLYEYETPESYESDIFNENTFEDGENVY